MSVSFSSQQSSGSVVAPLPFLYQCVASGNPAIVATKTFVFLNFFLNFFLDFLHNRLLFSDKLPGGSYFDFLYLFRKYLFSVCLQKEFLCSL